MAAADGITRGITLTSVANPRVKDLVRLRTRRARDEAGVTLVEGHDELRLALRAGVVPRTLYWAPGIVTPERCGVVDELAARGVSVVGVSDAVFAKIAYRESPDGLLAVADAPGRPLADLVLRPDPLVLVGEGIEKPGNLGAMLRTAEAFGVDAVVAASPATDLGNPNVVRASKGTVFAVPVAAAASQDVLAWLRDRGLAVVVTTPAGDAAIGATDLTGPTAIVVGAESAGVTDLWLRAADARVVIPMRGRVNSLNAATAAALALYEADRQRAALAPGG
ncbi:MAG: RNA methyltransferase [Pseudonocardia sp.]|nr:RNA methyltransferase [Pseudonocardia sp.]